jgi:hypothetical protein
MLESLLAIAVPALITVCVPYAIAGIHAGVSYLRSKAAGEKQVAFGNALGLIDDAASKAVALVAQTYVDQLKARGPEAFGRVQQMEAMRQAVAAAKIFAAGQLPALAAAGVTDVNQYLAQLVEAKIGQSKNEPAALPPFYMSSEMAAKLAVNP